MLGVGPRLATYKAKVLLVVQSLQLPLKLSFMTSSTRTEAQSAQSSQASIPVCGPESQKAMTGLLRVSAPSALAFHLLGCHVHLYTLAKCFLLKHTATIK